MNQDQNKEMKNDFSLDASKEATKNELLDSKKIDLYINNNDQESDQGISIVNVFSYMKQRFHIYIFVILATLILGLLIPLIMYELKDKNENALAVISFDYDGAESGLAPDGSKIDISYLKSSYIVQNALESVVLSKEVSVASIQSSITITGILTDDTKQKLEILDELKEAKSTEYNKLIQTIELNYRAQYIVSLKNEFNSDSKKVKLSSSDLSKLLASITNAYAEYFDEVYLENNAPNNYLDAIDTNTLDYLEILDEIQTSLTYLENFCSVKANVIPGYKFNNGMSFNDLTSIIHTVKSSDIDYIYSYIYLNNVSKDTTTALTNYKYQKREAELELSSVNENITTVKNSIDNYKSDKIVISSTDNNSTATIDVVSDYYNSLVNELTNLNERKSSLTERITILENRITMLEGTPATAEQIAKAESYVNNTLTNARNIYNLVNNHSEELYSSNAYKNHYMHAITTYESESITSSLRTFAIGALAGIFIGVVAWGVDAFVLEFKNNKRKQDEMEESR